MGHIPFLMHRTASSVLLAVVPAGRTAASGPVGGDGFSRHPEPCSRPAGATRRHPHEWCPREAGPRSLDQNTLVPARAAGPEWLLQLCHHLSGRRCNLQVNLPSLNEQCNETAQHPRLARFCRRICSRGALLDLPYAAHRCISACVQNAGGGGFGACSGSGRPMRRCTPPVPAHPARHGPLDDTRVERVAAADRVVLALDRHREAPYATTFRSVVPRPGGASRPARVRPPAVPHRSSTGAPGSQFGTAIQSWPGTSTQPASYPGQGPPRPTTVRPSLSAAFRWSRMPQRACRPRRGPRGGGRARGAAWLSSTGHPSCGPVLACTVAYAQVLCGFHFHRALLEGPPGGGINWGMPVVVVAPFTSTRTAVLSSRLPAESGHAQTPDHAGGWGGSHRPPQPPPPPPSSSLPSFHHPSFPSRASSCLLRFAARW